MKLATALILLAFPVSVEPIQITDGDTNKLNGTTYRLWGKFQALAALFVMAALVSAPRGAWAWGATGHEWISGIAIEKLPDSVPDFVRTPEAAAEIAVLGRELDRSRGAGKMHDAEPLYALEKEGGFKRGDQRGIAFATTRLAAGAAAVRDLIVDAWGDGASTPIGYPMGK